MSHLNRAFGRVLKSHREQAGISQEKLAFSAGLHPTYISQLERGLKSPSLQTLFNLASALSIKPSELVTPYEERVQKARR